MKRLAVPALVPPRRLDVLRILARNPRPPPRPSPAPNLLLVTVDTLRPDRLSCYSRGPPPDARDRRPGRPRRPLRAGLLPRAADPALPRQHPPRRDLARPRRRRQRPGRRPPRVPQPGQDAQGGGLRDRGLCVRVPSRYPVRARRGIRRLRRQIPGPGRRRSRLPRAPGRKDRSLPPWNGSPPRAASGFSGSTSSIPTAPYAPPEPYASRFAADPYSGEVAYVDGELGKLFGALDGPRRDRPDRRHPDRRPRGIPRRARRDDPRLFRLQLDALGPARRGRPRIGPRRVKDLVSHVDIFPTACDSARPRRASRPSRPLPPPAPRRPDAESPAHLFRSPRRLSTTAGRRRSAASSTARRNILDSPIPELYDIAERLRRNGRPRPPDGPRPLSRRRLTGRSPPIPRRSAAGPSAGPTARPRSDCGASAMSPGRPFRPRRITGPPTTSRRSSRSSRRCFRPAAGRTRDGPTRAPVSSRRSSGIAPTTPGLTPSWPSSASLGGRAGPPYRRLRARLPGQSRRFHDGLGPRHRAGRAAAAPTGRSRSSAGPSPSSTKTRMSGARSRKHTGRKGDSRRPSRISRPAVALAPRRCGRQRQPGQLLRRAGAEDRQCRRRQAFLRPFRDGHRHGPLVRLRPQRPGRRPEDRRRHGRGHRQLGEGRCARSEVRPARLQSGRGLSRDGGQGPGPRLLPDVSRRSRASAISAGERRDIESLIEGR